MARKRTEQTKGGGASQRRLRLRGVRRETPDLKKLSQALIALASAQLEAEAHAEHDTRSGRRRHGDSDAA